MSFEEMSDTFTEVAKVEKVEKTRNKKAWKSESLPRVFTVRADDNEYRKLKELSKKTNLSLSRMLIEATLFYGLKTPDRVEAEKQSIENLLFEVRKIGVNLNQITHNLNVAKFENETPPTAFEVGNAIKKVEDIIKELKSRLA
jgi:Bacterial mobilisation protein (MobC)